MQLGRVDALLRAFADETRLRILNVLRGGERCVGGLVRVPRVVVSAPVKDGPPNIVVGVNQDRYDLARECIVSAASCTTNCLAPLVRVLHDGIGIERGLVTTIHAPTNTQRVLDAPHSDPRRAG